MKFNNIINISNPIIKSSLGIRNISSSFLLYRMRPVLIRFPDRKMQGKEGLSHENTSSSEFLSTTKFSPASLGRVTVTLNSLPDDLKRRPIFDDEINIINAKKITSNETHKKKFNIRIGCSSLEDLSKVSEMYSGNYQITPVLMSIKNPHSLDVSFQNVETLILIPSVSEFADEEVITFLDFGKKIKTLKNVILLSTLSAFDETTILGKQNTRIQNKLLEVGLPFVDVQSNLFMEDFYNCESIRREDKLKTPISATTKFSPVSLKDVTEVFAHLLVSPPKSRKGSFQLTGPETLTFSEICDIMSEVLKRRISYNQISWEDTRSLMVDKKLFGGFFRIDAILEIWRAIEADVKDMWMVSPSVTEILDRPPISFKNWLKANKSHFKKDLQT